MNTREYSVTEKPSSTLRVKHVVKEELSGRLFVVRCEDVIY